MKNQMITDLSQRPILPSTAEEGSVKSKAEPRQGKMKNETFFFFLVAGKSIFSKYLLGIYYVPSIALKIKVLFM